MKPFLTLLLLGAIVCPWSVVAADTGQARPTAPPGVERLEAPGLHNLFSLSANLFSGSSPDGEAGFVSLAKLGVKTIISVDGAKPDSDLARKYGMRYVHLPHGYDGISAGLQLQLIKAGETLPGPFYVHCHHGKHRGPTAAAVMCLAKQRWTPVQAEAWLSAAGTATNYTGLYGVVRKFHKPAAEELKKVPAAFPETAQVSGLIDAMVGIDDHWDHLKAVQFAGHRAPKEHPDIKPANEAVILGEHFRQAQLLPDAAQRGTDFIDRLKMAEGEAKELERLLKLLVSDPQPEIRAQLDTSFDAITKTCSSCHKAYRDAAGIKAAQ